MKLEEEIRVGNLIYGHYEDSNDKTKRAICRVMGVDETGDYLGEGWKIMVDSKNKADYFDEFKPIPLDTRWLLQFGFKNTAGSFYRLGPLVIEVNSNKRCTLNDHFICNLPYVHSLQNLYLVLTGYELETKF